MATGGRGAKGRGKATPFAVLFLAIASCVTARLIAHYALRDVAHVMDEIAYEFQAKLFAAGKVRAPALEPHAAFSTWFVEDRGSRWGIFPPGWPAVLSIGVRLGLERWVNPVLHGVTVLVLYRAGRKLHGQRLGIVVSALWCASPQALLLGASLMSHTLIALLSGVILLAMAEVIRRRAPSALLALGCGAAIGLACVTRPLCGVVMAVGLLGTAAIMRPTPKRTGELLFFAFAGAAPLIVALAAYNRVMTGAPLRFPQTMWFDTHLPPANVPFFQYHAGCNDLGFGPGHGCDGTAPNATHTPMNALSNAGDNLRSWLLLACGPLLPLGVIVAALRKRQRRATRLLLAMPIAAIALYGLYWHGGTAYGARYYHAALPSVVLLASLGLVTWVDRANGVLVIVLSVLAFDGWAMARSLREIGDKHWGYWAVDDRFHQTKTEWSHGRALVMVAFGRDDMENPRLGWTATMKEGSTWMLNVRAEGALAENSALVDDSEVVFCKFHPALVDALHARFPDRSTWLYVMNVNRADDALFPYEAASSDTGARLPADNFDGFRIGPPTKVQDPMLSAPDEN